MSDFVLHDYQIVARDFLRGRGRAALFLDMGLGKTAASLSALEPRHLPALVVAPKKVAEEVWDVEVDRWRPDLSIELAVGSAAERTAALHSSADIVTLGVDNVKELAQLKRDVPFRTVIVDELSKFKGRGVRWKQMRKFITKPTTEYVWGLSGTPAPNGLLDLWAQIYLLDGGERLGKNITSYRSRYFMPGRQIANGTIVEWNIRPESEENIYNLLEDICLAMQTEGRIELPPVTHNQVKFELPARAKKAYNDLSGTMVADLEDLLDGKIHTASQAAALSNKLSQISAGFLYEDAELEPTEEDPDEYRVVNEGAYQVLHHEKVRTVREIVDSIDSPVLVFYQYKAELEMLREQFPDAHTADEKQISRRWNAGELPVLLMHPASAGHGLNLQHGGHHAIWTTLPWSLEHWDQANKRLLRQGQKNPVVIHTVMANNSVDYIIRARLVDKAIVQDSLLAHLESPI